MTLQMVSVKIILILQLFMVSGVVKAGGIDELLRQILHCFKVQLCCICSIRYQIVFNQCFFPPELECLYKSERVY